jgi:hypothetical protein
MLPFRQPLKTRHALGDLMEGLLVDGVDRHLRATEQTGIVERADFQDDGGRNAWPGDYMGAAFGAEFTRDRLFKIAWASPWCI